MSRAMIFTQMIDRATPLEMLRGGLVLFCALALIAAGHALPF